MTIIKTTGVTSAKHARNLRDYIEGKDAVLRDSMNIIDEERAFEEMAKTRRLAGHDKPARKGSKNTILLHFVLAFLPEEADFNGGPMSAEACMAYAREFAARRGYDEHQIVLALHRERCEADDTERWAVHMAVNRTSLFNGKRLHEGRSAQAKRDRASTVRDLDAEWGLQQVVEGVPSSKLHALQPQRQGAEKEIIDRARKRGIDPEDASYKHNLRELCRLFATRAESMEEYRAMLSGCGVETEIEGGKVYAIDTDNRKYRFSLERLDGSLSPEGLEASFRRNAQDARLAALREELRAKEREIAERAEAKEAYAAAVKSRYREYRKAVLPRKGAKLANIPEIRVSRPPKALEEDAESRLLALRAIRKADELRLSLASDAPKAPAGSPAGARRQEEEYRRAPSEPEHGAERGRGAR